MTLALDAVICGLLGLTFPPNDDLGMTSVKNPFIPVAVTLAIAITAIIFNPHMDGQAAFMLSTNRAFPDIGASAFRESTLKDCDVLVTLIGCSKCQLAAAKFCGETTVVERLTLVCGAADVSLPSTNKHCKLFSTPQTPGGNLQLPVVFHIRQQIVFDIVPFDVVEEDSRP